MQQALAYKRQHPEASYRTVAARFRVSSSTLYDHLKGNHSDPGVRTLRNLSIVQENALVDISNEHEDRGILLVPADIRQRAEALCEHPVGSNWIYNFLRRHEDRLSPRFRRGPEGSGTRAEPEVDNDLSPDTLVTRQTLRAIDRQLRRREITVDAALKRYQQAAEGLLIDNESLRGQIEKMEAEDALNIGPRAEARRERDLQGQLFDTANLETRVADTESRKGQGKRTRETTGRAAQSKRKRKDDSGPSSPTGSSRVNRGIRV